MKRLVISRAARADLRNIARYSGQEWGKARGNRYLSAIRDRFKLLQHRPQLGKVRRELGIEYRSLLVGRHIIFYRDALEAVLVVRVLHQRMDVTAHPIAPGGT
jgi:toxin ParE1/3/4